MEYHKATLKNVIYIVIYSISSIKGEKTRRTANLHHLDTKGTGTVDTQYDSFWKEQNPGK